MLVISKNKYNVIYYYSNRKIDDNNNSNFKKIDMLHYIRNIPNNNIERIPYKISNEKKLVLIIHIIIELEEIISEIYSYNEMLLINYIKTTYKDKVMK